MGKMLGFFSSTNWKIFVERHQANIDTIKAMLLMKNMSGRHYRCSSYFLELACPAAPVDFREVGDILQWDNTVNEHRSLAAERSQVTWLEGGPTHLDVGVSFAVGPGHLLRTSTGLRSSIGLEDSNVLSAAKPKELRSLLLSAAKTFLSLFKDILLVFLLITYKPPEAGDRELV